MKIMLIILILGSWLQCQSVDDGWKGIKPLHTTVTEVQKLLGEPEIDKFGYYRYKSDEAFVLINFSSEPCESSDYGRGKFNVPEGTVLDYFVSLQSRTPIANLKFNRNDYFRDLSGDVRNSVLYVNHDRSIIISASKQERDESAGRIYYYPRKVDVEKFKCAEKD
ncbi:MAG: hypothetical protein ACRD6X_22300 [Pyrinomonadaceae bacterium]